MRRRNLARVLWRVWLLSVLGSGAAAQQKQPMYDGHWWLSASPPERYGWIVGYLDCYVYEYKGPVGFTNRSTSALVEMIGIREAQYSKSFSVDCSTALLRSILSNA